MSDSEGTSPAPSSSKSERKSGTRGSSMPSKAKRTKHGRFVSDITQSEIESMFCYPAEEAAAKLGVCLTILKRLCRKFGISRWPYRRLKSAMKLKEHGMNPELVLQLNNPFQPATAAAVAAHVAAKPLPPTAPRPSDRPRRQAALGVAAVVDRAKEDIKDAEIATVPVSRRSNKMKSAVPMELSELNPEELAKRPSTIAGDALSLSALMQAVKNGSASRQHEQEAAALMAAAAAVHTEQAVSAAHPGEPMGQRMAALEAMLAVHHAQQAQAAVAAMAAAAGAPGGGNTSQNALLAALSSAFTGATAPQLPNFLPSEQELIAMAHASGLPLWDQGAGQATMQAAAAPPAAPAPPPPAPAPVSSALETAATERLNGAIMGLASLLKQANMPSAGWGGGSGYSK